ncbi:MAG: HTH domain-containing protein, partial [Caldiserica bacterium]|nr:HTH domain-containing protein [Caldisericota bacterium]
MKKELTPRERKLLKKVRIKELMEVHSGLLTDREKRILTLYSDPNLSGALIARRLNVSRQAIHDHVNRALAKMENCESKMHLLVTRKKR